MKNQWQGETITEEERHLMAEAASERATGYDLLFDVFVSLPGDALLSQIKDGRFDAVLPADKELDGRKLHDRAGPTASCRLYPAVGSPDTLAEELSVDRTSLLHATGVQSLRPPYEGLYLTAPAADGSVLQTLNRFYRRAGLSLEEESGESPDFLFVELDFMKRLCLRETEEWSSGRSACATRAMELEFLRWHIGRWVGAYCAEAGKHARTVFYRGFLAVLDGFIDAERAHLEE